MMAKDMLARKEDVEFVKQMRQKYLDYVPDAADTRHRYWENYEIKFWPVLMVLNQRQSVAGSKEFGERFFRIPKMEMLESATRQPYRLYECARHILRQKGLVQYDGTRWALTGYGRGIMEEVSE